MGQIQYLQIGVLLIVTLQGTTLDKPKKGKDDPSRIIDGVKARIVDYPFMVSILYFNEHICGGSIITDRTILTAAHCLCFDEHHNFNENYVMVSVGSDLWRKGQQFQAYDLIIHEDYNSRKVVNDIALIILKKTMSKNPVVATVKLSSKTLREDEKKVDATVLGWGFTSSAGKLVELASDQLMKVNIWSVTLKTCSKHYDHISRGHVCFSSDDKRGSCSGDSGGPLVIRKSTIEQIGIVSYSSDCNNTTPEVYTRISTYYKWISENAYQTKSTKALHRFRANNF